MLLGLLSIAVAPRLAFAQLSRVGNSQGVLAAPAGVIRGNDVGYDPVNNVYLVVGAYGTLQGVFTNASGSIVPGQSQFFIGSATGAPTFAQFPRVLYSPDVNGGKGGFLVVWHQNDGKPNVPHGAIVAYPNGVISADQAIGDGSAGGSWWEAGAPIAYSASSRRFLVAWQTLLHSIQGRFVDLSGTPSGGVMTLESCGARDPGLAWNSSTDDFGLASTAYGDTGCPAAAAFASFRRVAASSGALSARTTFGFSKGTFITDITFNPNTNHWLMGWGTLAGDDYAEIDQTGAVLGTGLLGVGTYDSLGFAYNVQSGSALAVGQGNSAEVLGLETNGQGVPISTAAPLTNGGGTSGSFYPRAVARSDAPQWNISYSRQFTAGADQIIQTATSLGGPVSDIHASIDTPATGTSFKSTDVVTVGGWVADKGASVAQGLGIDHVDVFAVSSTGATTPLGVTSSFTPRADIGGLLGTQWLNSGFSVSYSGGLPAGNYTVYMYPHSAVTGKYGTPKTISIVVGGSLPLMGIDTLTNGQTIPTNFSIGGWAIDKLSTGGTGIDNVQIWAFPSGGGATFLGAATLGFYRPDIGTFFGNHTLFDYSGYSLTTALPAGSYRITVYTHDALTNSFGVSDSRNVIVGGAAMSIDVPTSGTATLGSTIGGWAVDRGAPAGTGVDLINVWATPTNGGAAQFVGVATFGLSRQDVGSAFGSQFTNSGYVLPLGNVTSGVTYDLTVYAHSAVTGNWNAKTVRITAR